MKTYELKKGKVVWKDGKKSGAIPAAEFGSHSIEGEDVPGTGVAGPFAIGSETYDKDGENTAILLVKGGKLEVLNA